MAWRKHAQWAAVAWAAVAVLQGVIAYGGFVGGPAEVQGVSLAFAVSAAFSLYTAGRLASNPSASGLLGATSWAGLNLLLALWALVTGAGLLVFPFVVLLAGAGSESYQAWQGRRTPVQAPAAVEAAHSQASAPIPVAEPDAIDQIRKLGELRDAGTITPEEFDAKKAELLARL